MSKVQVTQLQTSPNNAATTLQHSETQGFEDHQTVSPTSNRSAALNRAKKSWKRMKDLAAEKENEAKRPPWRAVSVSTLPKPDKNALLRAKLLDASRRLRAGKVNVALQTDFVPTKLLKEASVAVQDDLILYKDAEILTDGQYSIKKDVLNEYVLTYSISQMTDSVDSASVSTQTLLPKAYNNVTASSSLYDPKIHDNQLHYQFEDAHLDFNEEAIVIGSANSSQGFKLNPTLESWQFDEDAIEMEDKLHFIPYTIEPYKPWRSFIPLPFQLRGNTLIGRQKIDWYALLQSIDELVRESHNLVDKLEGIMQEKSDHRKSVLKTLDNIRKFEPCNFIFPSEHWLPIIEKQEMELQTLENKLE